MITTIVILSFLLLGTAGSLAIVLWDREKLYQAAKKDVHTIIMQHGLLTHQLQSEMSDYFKNQVTLLGELERANRWSKRWKAIAKAYRTTSKITWRKA